ncbi:hypothetical protein BH11PAT1_BH11PAT1_5410 [soil metagenome]
MNKDLRIKCILHIDTTNNKEVVVALEIAGVKDEIRQALDTRKSQVVLPLIDLLLKKHALSQKDLSAIQVNPGPGSFTGIRVGLTIAQTLSMILKIPLNGKEPGETITAIYQ